MSFINGTVPIPKPNPRRGGGDGDIFGSDGVWSELGNIFENIWDDAIGIWRDDVAFDRRIDLLHAEAQLRDEAAATAAGTAPVSSTPTIAGLNMDIGTIAIIGGGLLLAVFVARGLK